MMLEFAPIFIYLMISLLVSLLLLGIPFLFSSPSSTYPEKLSAYECGFDPFGDARSRFDIRFYLVSILFLIFDLEVTFFFPWAVSLNKIDLFGFWSMMVFLLILTIGFVYEWPLPFFKSMYVRSSSFRPIYQGLFWFLCPIITRIFFFIQVASSLTCDPSMFVIPTEHLPVVLAETNIELQPFPPVPTADANHELNQQFLHTLNRVQRLQQLLQNEVNLSLRGELLIQINREIPLLEQLYTQIQESARTNDLIIDQWRRERDRRISAVRFDNLVRVAAAIEQFRQQP